MGANNETGVVQDIAAIARLVKGEGGEKTRCCTSTRFRWVGDWRFILPLRERLHKLSAHKLADRKVPAR
jgi:hypothetical protein